MRVRSLPEEKTIDAFLPVRAGDLDRVRLLLATLRHFRHPFRRVVVCVPGVLLAEARVAVVSFGPWVQVMADEELLELSWPLRTLRRLGVPLGARVQMLLKLVFAARSDASAVLTLDADCLLVRAASRADFWERGRLRTVRFANMNHERWYRDSAALLRVQPLSRSHGVTPALLSPSAVRRLWNLLGDGDEARAVRRLFYTRRRWTEYALYFSSFSAFGDYEDVHTEIDYGAWYAAAVWHPHAWPQWELDPAECADGAALFGLVQSWVGIAPAEIERKLRQAWPTMRFD